MGRDGHLKGRKHKNVNFLELKEVVCVYMSLCENVEAYEIKKTKTIKNKEKRENYDTNIMLIYLENAMCHLDSSFHQRV